jgi:hypothetical protein
MNASGRTLGLGQRFFVLRRTLRCNSNFYIGRLTIEGCCKREEYDKFLL